jgi:hypothetical protein
VTSGNLKQGFKKSRGRGLARRSLDLIEAIQAEIESKAWTRCAVVEKAERESLRHVLDSWKGVDGGAL